MNKNMKYNEDIRVKYLWHKQMLLYLRDPQVFQ